MKTAMQGSVVSGKVVENVLAVCESHPCNVIRGWDSHNQQSRVGIHWLRGSVPQDYKTLLLEHLQLFFGDYTVRDFGFFGYTASALFDEKISLHWFADKEECERRTDGRIALDITGGALDRLTPFQKQSLCWTLKKKFGFRCTRIDLFFDDAERVVLPREIYPIAQKKNFAHFKRWEFRQGADHRGIDFDEISFGSRGSKGSGAYLRIYDKKLESDGHNEAVRWEIEFSDEKADKVLTRLSNPYDDLRQFSSDIAATIGGCIDFIDRDSGDKNLSRCRRYEWWERLLSILDKCRVTIQRSKTTVERSQEWVENQVTGSLQMLRLAKGDESFFDYLLSLCDGTEKLHPHHYAAINSYKEQLKSGREFSLRECKDAFTAQGTILVAEF